MAALISLPSNFAALPFVWTHILCKAMGSAFSFDGKDVRIRHYSPGRGRSIELRLARTPGI